MVGEGTSQADGHDCFTYDDRLDTLSNREVMLFLRTAKPSSHPDVVEYLVRSASEVAALETYCPCTAHYRWTLLHYEWRVAALVIGMQAIAYRVDLRRSEALGIIGTEYDWQERPFGQGWVLQKVPWHLPDEVMYAQGRALCALAYEVAQSDETSPSFTCPVCGFRHLHEPPWDSDSGSLEICPSCGTQFGYSDAAGGDAASRERRHRELRAEWIRGGMSWWSTRTPPADWSPFEQVAVFEDPQAGT